MDKKVKTSPRGILFSKAVYSAEAVKLAAYVFSEKADIELTSSALGIEAEVSPLSGGGSPDARNSVAAGEFANEALNQQCRLDLAVSNGKIANMIVTKALLSALGETTKNKAGKK